MDHKQLLKDLGGEHAVYAALAARDLGISQVAVRAWALTDRAIPAKYWSHLKEIAHERGIEVSLEELAESVKASPAPPQAA